MCIIQGGTTNGTRAGWLRNTWHLPQNAGLARVSVSSTENAPTAMERDTTHAVILQGKLTARVARVLDTNSPLI